MYNLTETFEANGQAWKTDSETLKLMREFKTADNRYMVSVVFELGKVSGRIVTAVQVHEDSVMRLEAYANGNMLANCEECGQVIPVELTRCSECEAAQAVR